jgi:hypothetical protein
LVLGLVLATLAYCGWKVWQLGRRGWKDQLWFWDDANRAARFVLFIFSVQIVGRWVGRGWSDEVLAFVIGAAIIAPIPYVAYIIGRLLGMRDRARHGVRLS